MNPTSALFYRSQILDNCRLIFPAESQVCIVDSPENCYVIAPGLLPVVLLDCEGGLQEMYWKTRGRVAGVVEGMKSCVRPRTEGVVERFWKVKREEEGRRLGESRRGRERDRGGDMGRETERAGVRREGEENEEEEEDRFVIV